MVLIVGMAIIILLLSAILITNIIYSRNILNNVIRFRAEFGIHFNDKLSKKLDKVLGIKRNVRGDF